MWLGKTNDGFIHQSAEPEAGNSAAKSVPAFHAPNVMLPFVFHHFPLTENTAHHRLQTISLVSSNTKLCRIDGPGAVLQLRAQTRISGVCPGNPRLQRIF
jgi:hypothetical protein